MSQNKACSFHFPEGLFLLERHESWAFERFAYCVARVADQALRHPKYGRQFTLRFDARNTFDVSIGPKEDSLADTLDLAVHVTTFVPIALLGVCRHVGLGLLDRSMLEYWTSEPTKYRQLLAEAGTQLRLAAEVEPADFVKCVRHQVDLVGGTSILLGDTLNYFDVLAQFIANHELAHAYTGQFLKSARIERNIDIRACEVVADVVATEWIYNQMIRNTPDTNEYREMRGVETHEQALIANTYLVVHSQLLMLALFALLPAVEGNRRVDLDGGATHPHGFLRYSLDQVTLLTLVESNFPAIAQWPEFSKVDDYWRTCCGLFMDGGLLDPGETAAMATRLTDFPEVRRAAELIEQFGPPAVQPAGKFLRTISNPKVQETNQ